MHRSAHKRYWVPRSRKDTRITFFAIQGDETKTADLDQLVQLLVVVHIVGPSSIEEEMLFCRPLETTTEADVFEVVATCIDNSDMKWEKLVGICTGGGLAMLRSRSGLFARTNQKVPIPLISLFDPPWGSVFSCRWPTSWIFFIGLIIKICSCKARILTRSIAMATAKLSWRGWGIAKFEKGNAAS